MKLTNKIGLGLGLASLLCGVSSAQTFTRIIGNGDILVGGEPGEIISSITDVEVNNNGDWAIEMDGSGDTLSDLYVMVNGVIAFEEGTSTGIPSPAGFAMTSMDSMQLNDVGDQAWLIAGKDMFGANTWIIVRYGATIYQTNLTACIATGPANGLIFNNLYEMWANNNDQLLVQASVLDGTTTRRLMMRVDLDPMTGAVVNETIFALEGEILAGHTLPVQGFSPSKGRNAINDNGDCLFMVDELAAVTADNALDSNMYINFTQLINEADPFPFDMAQTYSHLTTPEMDLNNSGDWVYSGNSTGTSTNYTFLYTNIGGVLTQLARRGDPVPASIGGGLLAAGTHFGGLVPMSNNGNVLWYLDTDDADTTQDTYLLFDD